MIEVIHLARTAAANEPGYLPAEFADEAFVAWMSRVSIRVLNLPKSSSVHAIRRAYVRDGAPSSEWALAYNFALSIAQINRARSTQSAKEH